MKKFRLFGLFLLFAIGFEVNAQTYSWNIADGSEVKQFSEAVLTISDITGTIDGNYGNSNEVGLYRKSDDYQIANFPWGWCPYSIEVIDGTAKFTLAISSDAVYPDYPIKTDGEYYIKIGKGFFRYDMNWDTNTWTENEELRLNFTIKSDPAFVAKENVTITPEEGKIKQCPDSWVLNIANEEITEANISGNAQFVFFQNQWTQYQLSAEISNEGKTITLIPGDDLKNQFSSFYAGTYKVIVFDGSLYFNGDTSKSNKLMQFEYEIPEYADYNAYKTFPAPPTTRYNSETGQDEEVPSIISDLSRIEFYFQDYNPTIQIAEPALDKSNVVHVQKYNVDMDSWEVFAYLNAEIIPVEFDQYGNYTYAGVKLTPDAGTVFQEGEYKVVAPTGAFIVTIPATDWDSEKVKESKHYEVKYTVREAPEITTTPVWSIVEGEELESFTEVKLTFTGLTTLALTDEYDSAYKIKLYKVSEDESTKELGTLTVGVNDQSTGWKTVVEIDENGGFVAYMNKDNFAPYYPLDIDGSYRLVLPRGAYKFEGFNDLVNEASELNFTIKTKTLLKATEVELNPAPCEINDYPDKITVTFASEEIETMEVGLVEVSYWGYDENGYWTELFETKTAQAELVMSQGSYTWPTGQYYNIEVNAENPRQIFLSPDPETIADNDVLQFGSYSFRIPRGGLVANKGTNSECTNSVLDFGPYDYVERYKGSFYNPMPGEVEELYKFFIKYKDAYGNDASFNEIKVGETTPELYVYDEVKADWILYSELVASVEIDGTTGQEAPCVKLPYYPIYGGGRYKVVVPRETFRYVQHNNAIPTEAFEAEYTITSNERPYDITVTPQEGLTPFIDDVIFKFNDLTGAYIYAEYVEDAAVAFNEDGEVIGKAKMSCFYDENWQVNFLVDFEPAIFNLGPCRIVVGYGVIDTDYDAIGDNDSFEFNYNIIGGDPVLTVTPAADSTLKEFDRFTFAWQGALAVEVGIEDDPNMIGPRLYAETEEGTREEVASLAYTTIDAKTISLDIEGEPELANGKYVLAVPAGYFIIDEIACDAMEFTYNLEAVTYDVVVLETPFNKLSLTANYCSELKVNTDCQEQITLWYTTGGETQVGTYIVSESVGTTVEIELDGIVEVADGDYFVRIPAEYFWVDNDLSKEIKYEIKGVSSVESIVGDANFDIYSVNGMIIKRNVNKSDLKSLEPGVYVINGTKVFVK